MSYRARQGLNGHILDRFWEMAAHIPNRVAIVDSQTTMTYGELGSLARRLATTLADAGVRQGDRVAVFVTKSASAVAAFIGCLAAGAAYVPVDLASPAPRIARMMGVAKPTAALVGRGAQELLNEVRHLVPDWTPIFGAIDEDAVADPDFGPKHVDAADDRPLELSLGPTATAHVLFTSGSTGMPKGVAVTHGNVRHFIDWSIEYFDIGVGERQSGHAPFHFDLSTFDIYGSLCAGAELHLVPAALNLLPPKMAEFIADRELTQWFSVPTVLTQLVSAGVVGPDAFPSLRRLLWCGEAIPVPTLRSLMLDLPSVQFTNLYGPTEATIASSYLTVAEVPEPNLTSVSIGAPIPGEDLTILTEDLQPVEHGATGQLAISGAGITSGYWGDPSRTATAFIPHVEATGGRLYLTGDLARMQPDGLYLVGRFDQQIKSRGHRIELGEIEAALHRLASVRSAVVVAVDGGDAEGPVICSALVLHDGDRDLGIPGVRKALAELIPRYMLPREWRVVDELPLNPNGKADRRRIREWFESAMEQAATH